MGVWGSVDVTVKSVVERRGSDNLADSFDMTVAETSTSSFDPATAELVIQPRRGWIAVDWAEMIRFRELLGFLIWRDVKVRYKQSVLGVAWAVIVPVLNMLIFTIIFNVLFRLGKDMRSPDGRLIPYAIFVYSALLPWQLFSNSLGAGGMALLNQQHLITKIYFPRLFLPTAAVGGLLVDMAISFGVLGVLMGVYHFVPTYGFTPGWGLIGLPVLVLITIVLGLGVAYLLSALTVTYRDFRFLIPFANQILMYLSFVAYPIPESSFAHHPYLRGVAALNPMFGIIEAFRSAVLRTEFHSRDLAVSVAISGVMFVFGMFYFRRTERRFADIA
jgi:lipopolysaccharide transport system permease protein